MLRITGKMKPLILPRVIIVKNNIRIIPECIKEENVPALFQIARDNMKSAESGVSPLDFPSENHFLRTVRASITTIQYKLESTGKYIGFTYAVASETCRSCRPVACRGFTVLDPSVHNIGLGQFGVNKIKSWSGEVGFPGFISRSAANNKLGILHARKANLLFQAVVPDSFQDREGRWHDDLINTYHQDSPVFKMRDKEVLGISASHPSQFVYTKHTFKGQPLSCEVTLPYIRECNLHAAKEEDLQKLYPFLFRAAQKGEAFGLDELPTYEIFSKHFMKERVLIVLEKAVKKTLIGIAVIGPSRICRSPDPLSCSLYMLVMPEWRNQGIGTEFARLAMNYIKKSGYNSVLTDVLVTKTLPYRFMTRLGFSNVGCIPNSAFVAGKGYSDAILFYTRIKPETEISKL